MPSGPGALRLTARANTLSSSFVGGGGLSFAICAGMLSTRSLSKDRCDCNKYWMARLGGGKMKEGGGVKHAVLMRQKNILERLRAWRNKRRTVSSQDVL